MPSERTASRILLPSCCSHGRHFLRSARTKAAKRFGGIGCQSTSTWRLAADKVAARLRQRRAVFRDLCFQAPGSLLRCDALGTACSLLQRRGSDDRCRGLQSPSGKHPAWAWPSTARRRCCCSLSGGVDCSAWPSICLLFASSAQAPALPISSAAQPAPAAKARAAAATKGPAQKGPTIEVFGCCSDHSGVSPLGS